MFSRLPVHFAAILKFLVFFQDSLVRIEIEGQADALRTAQRSSLVPVLTKSPVPVSGIEDIQAVTLFLKYREADRIAIKLYSLLNIGTGKKNDTAHGVLLSLEIIAERCPNPAALCCYITYDLKEISDCKLLYQILTVLLTFPAFWFQAVTVISGFFPLKIQVTFFDTGLHVSVEMLP